MTQIFAIRNDYACHKELDLDTIDIARFAPEDIDPDDVLEFSYTNKPMAGWWETPETVFLDVEGLPQGSIPDLSLWAAGACLILSPKAQRFLEELIKPFGEFLPVKVGDEMFQIFNCLTIGKEDESKCRFREESGMRLSLEYLVFSESAAEQLIFKSKIENCLSLFCNEKLKDAVESFDLQGVIFDENLIEVF